jgi:hypothetical protein
MTLCRFLYRHNAGRRNVIFVLTLGRSFKVRVYVGLTLCHFCSDLKSVWKNDFMSVMVLKNDFMSSRRSVIFVLSLSREKKMTQHRPT